MRSVVRADDLLPPRRIGDEDFETICRTFGIVGERREQAREFLDQCVSAFAKAISNSRSLPSRKTDRHNIERALREIQNAARWLNQATGPTARLALRIGGRRIGPLVSAAWLRRRFPDDEMTPAAYFWPHEDRSGRSPAREPPYPIDVDDLSRDERTRFARRRARDVIAAILTEIIEALYDARRDIVEMPDGRKPLEYRKYLMAGLAELWHRLGKRPTSGTNSKFGGFCESVFDALGWPTEGVNAALSDAIATWKELYRS
jgi:hypothetical protein